MDPNVLSRWSHKTKSTDFSLLTHWRKLLLSRLSLTQLIEPLRWLIHSTSYFQWSTKETKSVLLVLCGMRDNTIVRKQTPSRKNSKPLSNKNFLYCPKRQERIDHKKVIFNQLYFNISNVTISRLDCQLFQYKYRILLYIYRKIRFCIKIHTVL